MREGWEVKKIGEIATFSQGIQVGLKHHEYSPKEGYVRFIRIIDYTQNTDDIRYVKDPGEKYFVNEDDIVMVRYGTPGLIGRGKSGVIANNLFKINLEHAGITKDYLCKYLSQVHIQKFLSSQGSATMPALNFTQLRTVDVEFPKSLQEQQQIVAILDEAFEAIDQAKANIEKNIENAKELFDSKKEILFGQLSDKFDVVPLDEVCVNIFAGGDKPKANFSKIKTDKLNIPVIANAVKNNGLYGYTNLARVTEPSITVAARGSGTGHTEYRDYPFVPIVRLIVLIPNTEKIDVEFLMHSIKSLNILRSGSAIPQLTVPMIKGYSIPVPDLKIQVQVVEVLNELEIALIDYKHKLELKIKELEELKKSILQKAFAGELTNKTVEV